VPGSWVVAVGHRQRFTMLITKLVNKIPRGRLRIFLVECARRVFRSRLCFPLTVFYIGRHITPVNHQANPELGILLSDLERWWKEDVEELGKRAQLFVFPEELRALILSLFFTSAEMSCLLSYKFSAQGQERKEALVRYLIRLIPALARRKQFDCIVTVNHMYVQNKPIAESCKQTRIPFIDLHKECMKDEGVADLYRNKIKKSGINLNFMGNKICVYNQFVKDLFVSLGVTTEENIVVTGALRIDSFIKRVGHAERYSKEKKRITLFSFRHIPTGDSAGHYTGQFSPDGKHGYVRLFDNVHSAFAELALVNPNVDFIIKLKWSRRWKGYVEKAILAKGYSLDQIPNIQIVAEEESAQDLILKSLAVIGLNSTVLLEGRLAGKPAILPHFDEIVDIYPDTVVFRPVFSELYLAKSVEDFKSRLQQIIESPPGFRSPGEKMVERYFGFNDGKSLDRVMGVLANSCVQNISR